MDEKHQKQIDEIMDYFEFEKVHKMMTAVDWTWHGCSGVPNIPELRRAAREHLRQVAKFELAASGSGGFTAKNNDGSLSLHWGVSWDAEDNSIESDE